MLMNKIILLILLLILILLLLFYFVLYKYSFMGSKTYYSNCYEKLIRKYSQTCNRFRTL